MPQTCSAVNCPNKVNGRGSAGDISFHRFPQEKKRRKAWLRGVRRINPVTKADWRPSKYSVLCSQHFIPSDFRDYNCPRRVLLTTAVPSQFNYKLTQMGEVPAASNDTGFSSTEQPTNSNLLQSTAASTSSSGTVSLIPIVMDHCYAVTESPRTLKRQYNNLLDNFKETKQSLYNANKRAARSKKTLSDLLNELKNEKKLSLESSKILESYGSLPLHLFVRDDHEYTEEQRQFATTLHFYSSKAYEFCRKYLTLPAESTIRRWISRIDGQPGFSEQVFKMLEAKVSGPDGWQYKSCSVIIDGMSIRKHIDWDIKRNTWVGFVDIGSGCMNSDSAAQEATEALVIMAVGLIGHWKIPLGYFLISGISADVQANLIKAAFKKLYDIGIRGMALIMDGLSTNQSMVKVLGGSMEADNIVSSFDHPSNPGFSIYIFFDACHLLKLVRNSLEWLKEINVPGHGTAKWSDIEKLHEFQKSDGLRAANKLTDAHIRFQQQKMKVRLAAQTLSSSVAKALHFLSCLKLPDFINTSGTESFISYIDRLFDIFNSRSPISSGFKRCLTPTAFQKCVPFLTECRDMLLSMTDSQGRRLCDGRRRMGFVGFAINIDSLLLLCSELLMMPDSPVHQKYLLTYKLSQDHLEMFFSSIRRRGGFNNNPSAQQFSAAYRTLLTHASVNPSLNGNVTMQDNTDLIQLGSVNSYPSIVFEEASCQIADMHDISHHDLSLFVENVLEYISGWVVRKLMNKITCEECRVALIDTEMHSCSESLLQLKDNGGLVRPSNAVVHIVKQAEKTLRCTFNINRVRNNDAWGLMLESQVLKNIPSQVFCELDEHFRNTLHGIDDHRSELIRHVCREFLRLRRYHIAKMTNLTLKGPSIRQKLTKAIIFQNQ